MSRTRRLKCSSHAEVEKFQPNFVKALVRYNPEDDEALNRRQAARHNDLSDTAHKHNRYFTFELLVPPTAEQNERAKGNQDVYDKKLRPALTAAAMTELQDRGIQPDVWKIEGLDQSNDCLQIAKTAQRGRRKDVGCIVLGRRDLLSRRLTPITASESGSNRAEDAWPNQAAGDGIAKRLLFFNWFSKPRLNFGSGISRHLIVFRRHFYEQNLRAWCRFLSVDGARLDHIKVTLSEYVLLGGRQVQI
jgi:hypothetical protein